MASSQPESEFSFPSACRIRSGSDFDRVYAEKQRAGDDVLLIFGMPNQLGISRIGLSVSKKHGNAVQRNRRKRLLREAFRLSRKQIPLGFDFVLIPRVVETPTLKGYRSSLIRLTKKIARRQSAPIKKVD
ncbi:MAG TPA: ribonuclease P protein component [Planctomycetaceae bacterium]|nr:ribonuclease P protein component [Planctomycetaceae bacterium]|tara:strand:- start:1470 stop:1859 length:390 start_codon:yes stop_codon:yes gene_type:complete